VGKNMVEHHHKKDQQVGTGFIESRGCLFRELNRGTDWIFSNNSVALQAELGARINATAIE
jgi:glycerophosphoryl diester phosphodiesterase